MTPLTRALTEIFYGKSPSYFYYAGCSTGGAQNLALAQNHPELSDGIFSGLQATGTAI
jgi:feruloyl esterase